MTFTRCCLSWTISIKIWLLLHIFAIKAVSIVQLQVCLALSYGSATERVAGVVDVWVLARFVFQTSSLAMLAAEDDITL